MVYLIGKIQIESVDFYHLNASKRQDKQTLDDSTDSMEWHFFFRSFKVHC